MALKTQGTRLYAINPADDSLITIGCVQSIDGIDTSIEQIETTCLSDQARTYVAGLATPGVATFEINFDPSDTTHTLLHSIKVSGASTKWAVGMSDGTDAAVVGSTGLWENPTTRSWIEFDGFMESFPFNFAQNTVVKSSIGIQVSGDPTVTAKI